MSETSKRFSRSAALLVLAVLLTAPLALAQTNPPFVSIGSVRVDDPKGSVILDLIEGVARYAREARLSVQLAY